MLYTMTILTNLPETEFGHAAIGLICLWPSFDGNSGVVLCVKDEEKYVSKKSAGGGLPHGNLKIL